jgi:hypothetical protein
MITLAVVIIPIIGTLRPNTAITIMPQAPVPIGTDQGAWIHPVNRTKRAAAIPLQGATKPAKVSEGMGTTRIS